jgi:hypothetical protein
MRFRSCSPLIKLARLLDAPTSKAFRQPHDEQNYEFARDSNRRAGMYALQTPTRQIDGASVGIAFPFLGQWRLTAISLETTVLKR